MSWHRDLAGTDPLDLRRLEDGSREHVRRIAYGGESADGNFNLCPTALIHGLVLRNRVRQEKGRADGRLGKGEIGGGGHVTAGIAAVPVVTVISAGAGQIGIAAEVSGTDGSALELLGRQFIADPDRDLAVRAVADDERRTISEFLSWAGTGGRTEAVMLGGKVYGDYQEDDDGIDQRHQFIDRQQ